MKIYHYTKPSSWENIKQKGLLPQDDKWSPWGGKLKPSVYCLLSPEPARWINNRHFPDLWSDFVHHLGRGSKGLLLEIDSSGIIAFVGDYAHLASPAETRLPKKFVHENRMKAEDAYIHSLIPLKAYFDKGQKHLLPEVLLQEPVLPDAIKICGNQPILERFIAAGTLESSSIWTLAKIPELSRWRTNFESANNLSLEKMSLVNLSGKERK